MVPVKITWWIRLLNWLGLYTKAQYNNMVCANHKMSERISDLVERVQKAESVAEASETRRKAAESEADEYELKVVALTADKQSLEKDVDKYRRAGSENLELIKGLQKQLGDLFREHPVFGFPSSIPIPGSTYVITSDATLDDNTKKIVCHGRSILTDDMTIKIDSTPSIEDRTNLITDYVRRYNVLEQIAYDLLRWGGIQLSLAYNKNCTAYEIYYELTADYAGGGLVVIDQREK